MKRICYYDVTYVDVSKKKALKKHLYVATEMMVTAKFTGDKFWNMLATICSNMFYLTDMQIYKTILDDVLMNPINVFMGVKKISPKEYSNALHKSKQCIELYKNLQNSLSNVEFDKNYITPALHITIPTHSRKKYIDKIKDQLKTNKDFINGDIKVVSSSAAKEMYSIIKVYFKPGCECDIKVL